MSDHTPGLGGQHSDAPMLGRRRPVGLTMCLYCARQTPHQQRGGYTPAPAVTRPLGEPLREADDTGEPVPFYRTVECEECGALKVQIVTRWRKGSSWLVWCFVEVETVDTRGF